MSTVGAGPYRSAEEPVSVEKVDRPRTCRTCRWVQAGSGGRLLCLGGPPQPVRDVRQGYSEGTHFIEPEVGPSDVRGCWTSPDTCLVELSAENLIFILSCMKFAGQNAEAKNEQTRRTWNDTRQVLSEAVGQLKDILVPESYEAVRALLLHVPIMKEL